MNTSEEHPPTPPEPSETPAAPEPTAPATHGHTRQESDDQTGLWILLIGVIVIAAYLIAFVVENSTQVKVHWVFGTSNSSVIWLIIVNLAIGVLIGVLASQLYRRRRRRKVSDEH